MTRRSRRDLPGRVLLALALAASPLTAFAQSAPPSTDIYLAPLTPKMNGIEVGVPVNITHRKGYDNEPAFTPDGRSVLYTSIGADGQADVFRYDVRDRSTTQLTHTPESEYSPRVMPGGKRFSVVRVERDSAQRLWSFAMDGSAPELVLPDAKPVGYYTWIDDHTLALYLLGRASSLSLADVRRGLVSEPVASDIGRSLETARGRRVSFLQHEADSTWRLMSFDVPKDIRAKGQAMADLGEMLPGSSFVTWLPGGRAVLAARDGKLFSESVPAAAGWTEVADLARAGLTHITRLAVSADGRWLALVADDAPSR